MVPVEKIEIIGPFIFFLLIATVSNCGSSQEKQKGQAQIAPEHLRRAVVAGQFYPADPRELTDIINGYLDQVPQESIYPNMIGLVCPHAGIIYSGQTAAYAYKQVAGNQYDAVIIVAPSHRERFTGASIWSKGAYETPLGLAPVNETLAQAIMDNEPAIKFSRAGHGPEHSLEIQLPFLQLTIPDLKIIPIVISDYSWANCQRIANAIARACKSHKVLLVASTDLYHGQNYDLCRKISRQTLEKIEAFKPQSLHKSFQKGESQACGIGPVVVVELVAQQLGATKAALLHRTNSNDVTGQRGGYVVGYGAMAIYREKNTNKTKEEVGIDMGLSLDEKKQLMKIARESIYNAVNGKKTPEYEITSPVLKEKRGAFVTIHKNNRLRGCIGYVLAYKPLYQTVSEMAKAAALNDPRFPQVQPSELDQLQLDISVLTPLRKIDDVNEIEVGKHGIMMSYMGHSGLLLPQVAPENNWDRETFLQHTCLKAGLPKDAWKKDADIYIYTSQILDEKEIVKK